MLFLYSIIIRSDNMYLVDFKKLSASIVKEANKNSTTFVILILIVILVFLIIHTISDNKRR